MSTLVLKDKVPYSAQILAWILEKWVTYIFFSAQRVGSLGTVPGYHV